VIDKDHIDFAGKKVKAERDVRAAKGDVIAGAAFSLFLRFNFEPCAAHRVPVVALASYVRIKANA
jgi:hypothetical protein